MNFLIYPPFINFLLLTLLQGMKFVHDYTFKQNHPFTFYLGFNLAPRLNTMMDKPNDTVL